MVGISQEGIKMILSTFLKIPSSKESLLELKLEWTVDDILPNPQPKVKILSTYNKRAWREHTMDDPLQVGTWASPASCLC